LLLLLLLLLRLLLMLLLLPIALVDSIPKREAPTKNMKNELVIDDGII
jgi:hypothetical protein